MAKATANTAKTTQSSSLELAKFSIEKSNKATNAATVALTNAAVEATKTVAELSAQITALNEQTLEAQVTLKAETDKLLAERGAAIDALIEDYNTKSEALNKGHQLAMVALQEKERSAKVDLDIRLKENKEAVLKNLLNEKGLAEVTNDAFKALQDANKMSANRISELETRTKEEETKAVNIAVNSALKYAKLEFAATEVELKSKVESVSQQLAAAREEVGNMKDQLNAMRTAMVDISANASKAGVVVNTANPSGK